jgi:hypothetical protein
MNHANPPSSRPMTLRQQLDDLLGYMDEEHVYPLRMSRVEVRNAIEELCQEIAREARLDELNYLMRLRDFNGNHKLPTIILSDRIAELTSPNSTAAGNDLPSYDPKADIEATWRRKGQLTQKPPQEEK